MNSVDLAMLNDDKLLRKARSLDTEALTEIHNKYFESIYRYISLRVSNLDAVEDFTSEVFTRLLCAFTKPANTPRKIQSWLFGTASNIVKEYYRSQRRWNEVELDDSLPGNDAGPEMLIEHHWEQQELRNALQILTDDQLQVLSLRYGSNLPIKDVAKTINKSEGAVKMLQMRAISALAHYLSNVR